MIPFHNMKNILGKKKILQINHNSTLSQSLTRRWVKNNVLLILTTGPLMSSSGLINNKAQVYITHMNL